jgi:hypothetical protein
MFLRHRLALPFALPLVFTTLFPAACFANPTQDAAAPVLSAPAPEIFAPGEISGPANDGAPTFSPDGNTLFFTRTTAQWTVIVESHKLNGHWSRPVVAPFSGEWPDSSPAMSPDGSYVVFQSTRPKVPLTDATRPKPGEPIPGIASNLWRVDRVDAGWSEPKRLPDAVNVAGQSIWKPSIAADGTIYLTAIDKKGSKRLYSSAYKEGLIRWRSRSPSAMAQRWMSIRRLRRMDRF